MTDTHPDIPRESDADGHVWIDGQYASELLLRGFDLAELLLLPSEEISEHNAWCDQFGKAAYRLGKRQPSPIEPRWRLSEPFASLSIRQYVLDQCSTSEERQRVLAEMDLYEARGLIPMLRVMYMLVDHFRRHNVVWGVGRGSSVASYVLFLLGVHKIDSIGYGLDIGEFLR